MSCPIDCNKIIDASQKLTPCECEGPGFCSRIGCTLSAFGYGLCRSQLSYYDLWKENAHAPCMESKEHGPVPFTLGLGDVVAFVIRVITLGFIKMCVQCQSRRTKLNRLFRIWPFFWKK